MVAALAIAALLCSGPLHVAATGSCKQAPDFSDEKLNGLKVALSGAVIEVAAPAVACSRQNGEVLDKDTCEQVTGSWDKHSFHAENPVSTMWNQYSNDSCLPSLLNNEDNPGTCDVSGYPSLVINATNAEQIKLAVDFSRENNVRLNIKNTGHDYIGRSAAPRSLSVWTHNMKDIEYNKDPYSPKGCSAKYESTVTVGAGVQMWELYEHLQVNYNRAFVGGAGPTVGVAGFVMGGGHSILSGKYGLAADQVVEMKVVTPDGRIRTLSKCSDKQLFWAMRGGGGSTFGVLTALTMKTYDSPKIAANLFAFATGKPEDAIDISTLTWSRLPNMTDNNATGYMFGGLKLPNPKAPNITFGGIMGTLAFVGSENLQALNDVLNSIAKEAGEKGIGAALLVIKEEVYENPWTYLKAIQPYIRTLAGRNMYMGSRLLSAEKLRAGEAQLRSATKAAFSGQGMGALLVGGKGLHEAKPPGGNAVHPGWRTAVASMFVTADFEPKNKASEDEAIAYINAALGPLRELDEKSGCYSNEAFPFEPKWRKALFGSVYKKLLKFKEKYDPNGVFWCHHCVGSDKWVESENGLCEASAASEKPEASEEPEAPSTAEEKGEEEKGEEGEAQD